VREAVLTDCSSGKYSAADSERQIDDLDELVAVDDAFAPDGVEIGERLFRDGFLRGFSRGLQFLNAIARSDEHVTGFQMAPLDEDHVRAKITWSEQDVGGGKLVVEITVKNTKARPKTDDQLRSDARALAVRFARAFADTIEN
jgi:hypothetical protein